MITILGHKALKQKMEKASVKVALEKNETARREITGVKADTITATNAGDGLASSKTQVRHFLSF